MLLRLWGQLVLCSCVRCGSWCCALVLVGAAGAVLWCWWGQLGLRLVWVPGIRGRRASSKPPWSGHRQATSQVAASAHWSLGIGGCPPRLVTAAYWVTGHMRAPSQVGHCYSMVTGHRRTPSQVGHCCLLGHWAQADALTGWSLLLTGHWAQEGPPTGRGTGRSTHRVAVHGQHAVAAAALDVERV